jgi:hypothetical protein
MMERRLLLSVLAASSVVSGSASPAPQAPAAPADITLACQSTSDTFSIRIWMAAQVLEMNVAGYTEVYSAEIKQTQISFTRTDSYGAAGGAQTRVTITGTIDRLTGEITQRIESDNPTSPLNSSRSGKCVAASANSLILRSIRAAIGDRSPMLKT